MIFSTAIQKLTFGFSHCFLPCLLEISYTYVCIGMHLPAFMHDHKGSTLRIANPLLWCLPKHAEQHSVTILFINTLGQ